jgi:putative redox protein
VIPRMSKQSVIATSAGGQAFDVSVRGHTVRTDQPIGGGGADTAPTPLEMLNVSLAGCIALYVQRFCDRRGLDARGLSVEVNPIWRAEPGGIGRFDVLLHLPGTIPETNRHEIELVARACPVHHTLLMSPEISVKTVLPAAESARGPAAAKLAS